jgi:hypothetical protein
VENSSDKRCMKKNGSNDAFSKCPSICNPFCLPAFLRRRPRVFCKE